MMKINPDWTLFEICEKNPALIDVLATQGFPGMSTEEGRNSFGKAISLRKALKTKNKDLDTYMNLLENSLGTEDWEEDVTLAVGTTDAAGADISVAGLLPCPVRIPMLEQFREQTRALEKQGISVHSDLKAASTGIDWLKPYFEKESSQLPDIFLSAGFDLFFDRKQLGHFIDDGVFSNPFPGLAVNSDFSELDIEDPRGHYTMVSVVPAVFLVNEAELNGREAPRTWEDLLMKPEWNKSVSLPVGDFDLFNAILVGLYSRFGDDGIKRLSNIMYNALSPAQMLKPGQQNNGNPAVTIVPYFFTRMLKPQMSLSYVWPEDGAILSPIFLMVKSDASEETKGLAEWFTSKGVGELFSHQGLFPSLMQGVENNLPKHAPVYWPGWDFIYNNDIGALITRLDNLFSAKGGAA